MRIGASRDRRSGSSGGDDGIANPAASIRRSRLGERPRIARLAGLATMIGDGSDMPRNSARVSMVVTPASPSWFLVSSSVIDQIGEWFASSESLQVVQE